MKRGFLALGFAVVMSGAPLAWGGLSLQLIDRGVPFTLTTVETTSAHLQAIIGYDQIRETILIRDPYVRNLIEFGAKSFFERYQSTGPRGMVLVPPDRSHLLEGITLPDAKLYTHLHQLSVALKDHDRAGAEACYAALEREWPSHMLTLRARR